MNHRVSPRAFRYVSALEVVAFASNRRALRANLRAVLPHESAAGVATTTGFRWLAAVLSALLVLVGTKGASAQRSFYLDRVQVSGAPEDGFITRRPLVHDVTRVYGSASLGYALNPLRGSTVARNESIDDRIENLIRHQVMTYLNVGIEIGGRASIEAALPVAWVQSGGDIPIPGSPPPSPSILPVDTGTALYDASLSGRFVLYGGPQDDFRAAVGGMFFIPSGNFSRGGSDDRTTLYLYAAAEHEIGPVLLVGNLGPHFRPLRGIGGADSRLDLGTELRVNAAAFLDLFERLRVGAELNGMIGLDENERGDSTFLDAPSTPFELLGSGKLWLGTKSQTYLRAAAGTRLTNGYGAPDLRVMVSIGHWLLLEDFMPKDQTRVRGEPDFATERPGEDTDRDGDGYPDDIDLCPDLREDGKQPRPSDGCPVTSDRDGDGIVDLQDACPDAAEDKDGIQDSDGCPERDVDGDGTPDERDACPFEPGVEQGDPKRNGCPRQAPETRRHVVEDAGELKLLSPVLFESGTAEIKPTSYPVLDEVVQVMVERPTIRIAVHGHTDNTGSAALNLQLSQDRAQAVVAYLSEKGIALDRLTYRGFGMEKPIAPNATEEGRAKNRRVEFKIIEPGPARPGP